MVKSIPLPSPLIAPNRVNRAFLVFSLISNSFFKLGQKTNLEIEAIAISSKQL